jgi:hypothetical protein
MHPFVKDSGYFSNPANANTLITEFLQMMFVEVPDGTVMIILKVFSE